MKVPYPLFATIFVLSLLVYVLFSVNGIDLNAQAMSAVVLICAGVAVVGRKIWRVIRDVRKTVEKTGQNP